MSKIKFFDNKMNLIKIYSHIAKYYTETKPLNLR